VSILATAPAAGNPPRMGGYTDADLARLMAKVSPDPGEGCLPWTAALDKDGYGRFWLGNADEQAHRAAWLLAGRAIPDGLYVLHRCDRRACVNAEHLFLGTQADNVADMVAKGRQGEHPCTGGHQNVGEAAGEAQREVAQSVGVSEMTVSLIVRRRRWAHVPETP
jgi:hypothetical protein